MLNTEQNKQCGHLALRCLAKLRRQSADALLGEAIEQYLARLPEKTFEKVSRQMRESSL